MVRDGKSCQSGAAATANNEIVEKAFAESASETKGERDDRALSVGDRVRLRSFGSIGIVDQIKDDEAEVRVGSLHMREKLENLELVDEVTPRISGVSTASG